MAPLELDAASYPEWRDGILSAEAAGLSQPGPPRSYPGYPKWPLEHLRPRLFGSLDRVMQRRRSARVLSTELPDRTTLSRLLGISHGITAPLAAGPVPSAGGLQALELYLAAWLDGWLPAGTYHYDRTGHHLSQIIPGGTRAEWQQFVPSLALVEGGAFLWILVGDGARIQDKYGSRGARFLLQESGHLMQNLCLASASLGLTTTPLGGYFEQAIARRMQLPQTDLVLYVGVCGVARG